ncbi:MAG TPA: tryptophan synthase subunit alpha [Candidatus Dormibacteraeota bacterium]|nr:tryptophan synthase subunit alpha [Candidatus Dormibacteraeota bacterium]
MTVAHPAGRLQAALRAGDGIALVPYLMAGYPDLEGSARLGRRYAGAGVAAIEVGVPFSDPLADGPVIQRVGQMALERGIDVRRALRVASAVADTGVPVVLMTYVNPILAYGPRRFAADAAGAGVSAVIMPDLPVEESEPMASWLREAGLGTVFLVAPTSPDERVARIVQRCVGFVYCVTLRGVTGARAELAPGLAELLARVRRATDLPVAAGFGISRPEHVRQLRGRADAAVVASALLDRLLHGEDPIELLEAMVAACR